MNLSEYIDLLPDVYDKSSAPKSRIRKLFEVTADALQILIDTATENKLVKDLFHASGDVLDAIGEDYGLPRYGMNDDDYRALILAKIFARISGNAPDKIINYFRFFTALPINVVNLTEDSIRLPTLLGAYIWRAFSVEIPGLSPTLRSRLLPALQILKPAGVYGTINFSQVFNPSTDLAGVGYTPVATAGESWQSAQNDGEDVLITVGKIGPGEDMQVMRVPFSLGYTTIGSFAGGGGSTLQAIHRAATEVTYNYGFEMVKVTLTAITKISPDPTATVSWLLHSEPGLVLGIGLYSGPPAKNSRVFRSTDNGATWSQYTLANNNVLTADSSYIKAASAHIIGLRTSDNELIFLRSINAGVTWTESVVLTGTTMAVTGIAKSPDNVVILAVTAYGTTNRLYRSVDNGASWSYQTYASVGLPATLGQPATMGQLRIYSLGGSSFFIVSSIGTYRSDDNGLSWTLDTITPSLLYTLTEGAGALWMFDGNTLLRYSHNDSAPVPFYTERFASKVTLESYQKITLPFVPGKTEVFEDPPGRLWISAAEQTTNILAMYPVVSILSDSRFPDKLATYYVSNGVGNRLATYLADRIVAVSSGSPTGAISGQLYLSAPLNGDRVGLARLNRKTKALTKITLPPIAFSRCVRYNGKLVLASVRYDGLILYSEDEGSTWRECKFTGAYRPTRVHTLVEFQGKLIAVCHEYLLGTIIYKNTYIFDSVDGVNFVYRTAATGSSPNGAGLKQYRTVADDQYVYLTNGLRFNGTALIAHVTPPNCVGLAVRQGKVFALAIDALTNSLELFESADHGSTYTPISTATLGTPRVLGIDELGITVALSQNANPSLVSYDRINWLTSNLPNQIWEDVAVQHGQFVAISESEVSTNIQVSRTVLP